MRTSCFYVQKFLNIVTIIAFSRRRSEHTDRNVELKPTGPNFMALLTVSTESALTEAENSVLTASVFHGLAANFGFCVCALRVTRHSMLTRLAQKFG